MKRIGDTTPLINEIIRLNKELEEKDERIKQLESAIKMALSEIPLLPKLPLVKCIKDILTDAIK